VLSQTAVPRSRITSADQGCPDHTAAPRQHRNDQDESGERKVESEVRMAASFRWVLRAQGDAEPPLEVAQEVQNLGAIGASDNEFER